jgi:hypothetical protein
MFTSGESIDIVAAGPWTRYTLNAANNEVPPIDTTTTISTTVPYSGFSRMFGGTELPKITAADYVFLLRHKNGEITGVLQAQFDQSDMADPLMGNVTDVVADKTLTAGVDPTGYSTRFSAVRPAPSGLSASWNLTAAPGADVGSTGGVVLKSGAIATTDTQINTMFGNPFESLGWKSVLTVATSTLRMTPYMYMGMPVGLGSGMVQVLEAPAGNMALTLPAGLPITIRANLTALTTDGMSVPLDLTKPVEIDAIVDKPTATLYRAVLSEVQLDGTLKRLMEATFLGTPKVKLPPELFTVGKAYAIRVYTYEGGFTAATSGDLQPLSVPFSYSYLDGGVFTVVAP